MKLKPYPAYKDSGVEWLSMIPCDWNPTRLKHVASVVMGQSPSSEDCNQEGIGIPFLQGCAEFGDIHPVPKQYCEVASKVSNIGDLLFSVRAPVGSVNYSDQHYGIGRGLCAIRGNAISHSFLIWSLEYNKTQLNAMATGSTYEAVTINEVSNIEIALPSHREQQLIAKYLDRETGKLDNLISKQIILIELLQEKRKVIISCAVTKGLNRDVTMKDSCLDWLGMMPEHWSKLPTKQIFKLIVDPAPDDNDFELLSIYTDIGVRPRKDLEAKGNKATTTDGYFRVKKNDFIVNKLLAWMGAIGLSAYDGVTSPAYDILRASRKIDYRFYDYLFRCGIMFIEFKKYSRGIMDMRLRLYFEEFGQLHIPYPPDAEQTKIADYLDEQTTKIDTLIVKAKRSIELAKEHRIALISAAVTGKIYVRSSTDNLETA